jgi:hypothetical protein
VGVAGAEGKRLKLVEEQQKESTSKGKEAIPNKKRHRAANRIEAIIQKTE